MKQSKVRDYRPNYPKKLMKSAVLTTAAAVALAGTTGCRLLTSGTPQIPVAPEATPAEELVIDGDIAIEDPTEEPMLEGEPAVDESGEIIRDTDGSDGRESPALMGKIAVPEETENP